MAAIITIDISGVRVSGRITEQTHADIEIELLDPYGDLRLQHSAHIPAFARRHQSFDGERGDRRALELLAEMYESAFFVVESRDVLRLRWAELSRQLSDRCGSRVRSRADLAGIRSASRGRLRRGEITAADHEQIVRLAADEWEDWRMAVTDAVDQLFEATPVSPALSLRMQLMQILDPAFEAEALDDRD